MAISSPYTGGDLRPAPLPAPLGKSLHFLWCPEGFRGKEQSFAPTGAPAGLTPVCTAGGSSGRGVTGRLEGGLLTASRFLFQGAGRSSALALSTEAMPLTSMSPSRTTSSEPPPTLVSLLVPRLAPCQCSARDPKRSFPSPPNHSISPKEGAPLERSSGAGGRRLQPSPAPPPPSSAVHGCSSASRASPDPKAALLGPETD